MPFDTDLSRHDVRPKWGWFVALGVVLLLLGLFALGNLFVATVASVLFIGIIMMVAAAIQIAQSLEVKRWGGFFYLLLSGLLYGAAGFLAFYNPTLAAATFTFMLAIMLIAAGIVRIGASLQFRPDGWGWGVASGVITILVGLILALGWPTNTLWTLGLVLAIDLTFQGVAAIATGFALKGHSRTGSHQELRPT